tara:strand:+ start:456 stop:638 length:183 start_codon:yes stop_codon:yes gene_type:complete
MKTHLMVRKAPVIITDMLVHQASVMTPEMITQLQVTTADGTHYWVKSDSILKLSFEVEFE